MGKRGRNPLSAGSVLALSLTLIVTAGCVAALIFLRGGSEGLTVDAGKLMSALSQAVTQETTPPLPTVKLTLVTAAPVLSSQDTQTQQPVGPALSLTIGGMLGFHSDVTDAAKGEDGIDYGGLFSLLSGKITADINIAALENVLSGTDKRYADVSAPPSALDAVQEAGFNLLLLNHEHILDYGAAGINATLEAAEARGLMTAGVTAAGESRVRLISVKGANIAVLSYIDGLTNPGKKALSAESYQDYVTAFSMDAAKTDIAQARAQGADAVLVFLRWGKEDAEEITAQQRTLAQQLTGLGVDIIVGSRCQGALPVEIMEARDASGNPRRALVAYSLGSLLTEARSSRREISSFLLHVKITCVSGGVRFDEITYTPAYIWKQSVGGHYRFRVVCSADPAPDGMNEKQKEYMGNGLRYINGVLADGPAALRAD